MMCSCILYQETPKCTKVGEKIRLIYLPARSDFMKSLPILHVTITNAFSSIMHGTENPSGGFEGL